MFSGTPPLHAAGPKRDNGFLQPTRLRHLESLYTCRSFQRQGKQRMVSTVAVDLGTPVWSARARFRSKVDGHSKVDGLIPQTQYAHWNTDWEDDRLDRRYCSGCNTSEHSHLTKCIYEFVSQSQLPTISSTYCLLSLIQISSWRFCGGVDLLKLINK